jgi:hypothetical protein
MQLVIAGGRRIVSEPPAALWYIASAENKKEYGECAVPVQGSFVGLRAVKISET